MWVRVFVRDKFQSFIFKMLYRLDTPPCHITIQNLNKEPERSIQNNVYQYSRIQHIIDKRTANT
jgi:hypothetical protein